MKNGEMRSLFAFLFLFIAACCSAQNDPSFRQFYFNPFHFNPAYTGIDGHTDVYFSNRRQWVGFNDAPVVSQFSVQYATRERLSLGFTVSDLKVVALRNTFISGAIAYRVPVARKKSLTFALSGGVGSSNLDLGDYNYSNDPTILNAATTSIYGNASFGMLYDWKQLRVGFALPQLFGQNYISPQKLGNKNSAQLQKQNYSVAYKFSVSSFSIEPWFLFRLSDDNQNSWDGGATVSYNKKIWLGSSYNTQQGTGFFFGLEVKEILKVGCSYELPSANGYIQNKSMEFQLRVRLNPKRAYTTNPKVDEHGVFKTTIPDEGDKAIIGLEEIQKEANKVAQRKDTSILNSLPKTDSVSNPATYKGKEKTEAVFSDGTPLLKHGYYLVMGSFRNPNYASNYKEKLIERGFSETSISFNANKGLYLVHIFFSSSKDIALQKLTEFQLKGLKPFPLFVP
jgi:type IX secretion system PorP/SprF family membrane protein